MVHKTRSARKRLAFYVSVLMRLPDTDPLRIALEEEMLVTLAKCGEKLPEEDRREETA